MKKLIKKIIYKNSDNKIINFIFFQRKYHALGFGTFIVNVITQRLFRINSSTKWQVHFTSRIIKPEKIKIFDNKNNPSVFVSFSSSGGCYIQANNGIELHKNVMWAYGVTIVSSNHDFANYSQFVKTKPIIIYRDVWIGANSVILPGVEIGEYSVIGAGSVVNKDTKPYSIVAGNPAVIIGYRCKKCYDKLEKREATLYCKSCLTKYTERDFE